MSRRSTIKDLYAITPEANKLAVANSPLSLPEISGERVSAGPVRSMGLALDRIEQESRALQNALATGATVIELDPAIIASSFVRDRFTEVDESNFSALKKSIEDYGQEVPILVRPHPDIDGHYQVAYGHRRLRAVSELGRKIKAVVRILSDIELIVAQGLENSARRDLSYIERAIFAAKLEHLGFERAVIIDALSTDKGELSKLLSVAHAVPENIIEIIGPAPKAGRRRWLILAELLVETRALRAADLAIKSPDFPQGDSDARFLRVFSAALDVSKNKPQTSVWKSSQGHAAAKITRSERTLTVAIDQTLDPNFGEFVAAQLDSLYEAFQSRAKARD